MKKTHAIGNLVCKILNEKYLPYLEERFEGEVNFYHTNESVFTLPQKEGVNTVCTPSRLSSGVKVKYEDVYKDEFFEQFLDSLYENVQAIISKLHNIADTNHDTTNVVFYRNINAHTTGDNNEIEIKFAFECSVTLS